MSRLLLLEDEPILRSEVASYLAEQGYNVDSVDSLANFRAVFSPTHHLIALVDLGLPDGDGIALIDWLRKQGNRLGIIVISARSATIDKVRGLDAGADHYLTKPFELEELAAITAALARRLETGSTQLRWLLDLRRSQLTPPGQAPVQLTAQSSIVLSAIAVGQGQPVARQQIIKALGADYIQYDQRRLETQIYQIRRTVFDATGIELPLRALRNRGYIFEADIEIAR